MYEYLSREHQRSLRSILSALIRYSLLCPVAWAGIFSLLFAALAALVGLHPVDFALHFLSDVAIALSGVTTNLWLGCYLSAAICFGVGRNLPGLLQHRSLNSGIIVRFTQSAAIRAAFPAGATAFYDGPCRRQTSLTRPSRTTVSTASDLAGSAPRLE